MTGAPPSETAGGSSWGRRSRFGPWSERRLTSRGFDVTAVYDGCSAVAAALKLVPDVMILDIRMPG
jgi:DNA-binding response OmpR family regulator